MLAALVDFMAKARNTVPPGADEHAQSLGIDLDSEVISEALGEKNFGSLRRRLALVGLLLHSLVRTARACCKSLRVRAHFYSPWLGEHPAIKLTPRQEAA